MGGPCCDDMMAALDHAQEAYMKALAEIVAWEYMAGAAHEQLRGYTACRARAKACFDCLMATLAAADAVTAECDCQPPGESPHEATMASLVARCRALLAGLPGGGGPPPSRGGH